MHVTSANIVIGYPINMGKTVHKTDLDFVINLSQSLE